MSATRAATAEQFAQARVDGRQDGLELLQCLGAGLDR
jgi:hypothetical protein